MRIEPICLQDHLALRDVRLRALQEAPAAFGSTYARESTWDIAAWQEKAAFWDGLKARGFLAWDDTNTSNGPCGIAGCLLHVPDPASAPASAAPTGQLVSVWIDPRQRGRGLARRLVEHCADWAAGRGAASLLLTVTSNNQAAIRLYERLGFEATDRIHPYRNDPALHEVEMVRSLPRVLP